MMSVMRRESSTVIVLAGDVDGALLSAHSQSSNVTGARAPAPEQADAAGARPAWEAGALAMREAARRRSTYVIVPDDPLADVAAAWRAMWAAPGGPDAVAGFELAAGTALAAWHDKRFELPDYYVVMTPAAAPAPGPVPGLGPGSGGGAGRAPGQGTGPAGPGTDRGPDLYLGPLRAVRPRRVAVAVRAERPGDRAAALLDTLRALEPGPWWPSLGDLLDVTRNFFAGGLAPPQLAAI
jgi:hypothetical protein